MTTQKDVAKKAGVSFITVSRVINNKGNVKQKTRERVLRVIKELNYYPNTLAQGLNANKSNTISILPSLRDQAMMEEISFYRRIIAGVERYCCENEIDILLSTFRGRPDNIDCLRHYYLRKSDGLIMIGVSPTELLEKIERDKIPCSFIGETGCPERANFLQSDNRWGSRQITEYLIKNGHTKIAYIFAENPSTDIIDRYESFKEVMKENNLDFPDSYLFYGDFMENGGREAIRKIASMRERPTAIVSATDRMALGVFDEAKNVGLSIPEDISLVGFDGHEFCEFMTPQIATVIQDLEGMGYMAAKLISEQIDNSDKQGESHIFPVVFEPRGTIRNIRED
jgi:LacI family transcriptional regulator